MALLGLVKRALHLRYTTFPFRWHLQFRLSKLFPFSVYENKIYSKWSDGAMVGLCCQIASNTFIVVTEFDSLLLCFFFFVFGMNMICERGYGKMCCYITSNFIYIRKQREMMLCMLGGLWSNRRSEHMLSYHKQYS